MHINNNSFFVGSSLVCRFHPFLLFNFKNPFLYDSDCNCWFVITNGTLFLTGRWERQQRRWGGSVYMLSASEVSSVRCQFKFTLRLVLQSTASLCALPALTTSGLVAALGTRHEGARECERNIDRPWEEMADDWYLRSDDVSLRGDDISRAGIFFFWYFPTHGKWFDLEKNNHHHCVTKFFLFRSMRCQENKDQNVNYCSRHEIWIDLTRTLSSLRCALLSVIKNYLIAFREFIIIARLINILL